MARHLASSRRDTDGCPRTGGSDHCGFLGAGAGHQRCADAVYRTARADACSNRNGDGVGAGRSPTIHRIHTRSGQHVCAGLKDRGISFANPEAAIYNGKLVCDDIRLGMTVPQIVTAFRASNPALGGDADNYVAISVHAYCPQNGNLVSAGS